MMPSVFLAGTRMALVQYFRRKARALSRRTLGTVPAASRVCFGAVPSGVSGDTGRMNYDSNSSARPGPSLEVVIRPGGSRVGCWTGSSRTSCSGFTVDVAIWVKLAGAQMKTASRESSAAQSRPVCPNRPRGGICMPRISSQSLRTLGKQPYGRGGPRTVLIDNVEYDLMNPLRGGCVHVRQRSRSSV